MRKSLKKVHTTKQIPLTSSVPHDRDTFGGADYD